MKDNKKIVKKEEWSKTANVEELSLEDFLTKRIDNLKHELAHANNAIHTHTQKLQAAQEVKQAAIYRIDELEQLQSGLSLKPPEPPNAPQTEKQKTPGS